jgi:hypothetical protein
VCEKLLHVVAFSCRACLAMKPLAEGASADIELSGCFRYIGRARGSQERDRLMSFNRGSVTELLLLQLGRRLLLM